ncbi:YesL family protein [Gracilibacillus lacisalsi]|uniref:YesL family protein n=1 Tax=Gracilibacillus lacisalsi TaxID=393087 RepID=UPI00036E48DA|nr:YesL family protein [Gracilibacillus lacisalsi]
MPTYTSSFIYKVSDWIMKLSLVNLLWICFSILGLGFLGLFPATVAMYTVVRKWMKGNTDVSVMKTFIHAYKGSFLKANLLGYISSVGGLVLYGDYLLVRNMEGMQYMVMLLLLVTVSFYYLMMLFFVFPVYVHYDIKLMECFKYAFIIGASYPLRTIYILFVGFVVWYLTASFPIILLFFSGSVMSLVVMRFAYVAFKKTEERNRNLTSAA